jgi:hypothetical protein
MGVVSKISYRQREDGKMKKSLTRIRTSHVGRLPPPKGWEDMPARLANAELTDPAAIEAAIGVPALKAVSRLIRELLRTRTGPGDRDLPALQLGGIPDPLCRRSTGHADCRHCSLCAEAGRYQR